MKKSNLSAPEIAARAEKLGATVPPPENSRYKIFPPARPDGTLPKPVFISTRLNESHARQNAIAQLKRVGLDITALDTADITATPTTKESTTMPTPTPADIPAARVNGHVKSAAAPDGQIDAILGMLAEAEQRHDALHDALRGEFDRWRASMDLATARISELEDRIDTHGGKIDVQRAATQAHDRQLAELRRTVNDVQHQMAGAPTAAPKPPSKTTILENLVQAFFESHPGIKWTPAAVRANIDTHPDFPAGLANTAVPSACHALCKRGVIEGGSSNPRHPQRGIYWLAKRDEPTSDAS